MRQSILFTKTTRELPKDETSYNAQVLIRAGFIDKLMAGVYSFLPLGNRVHEKIKTIIREEMDAIGGQEIFMPALTSKEVWETTNRWENFDALFKFKDAANKEYALGATHEEIVTPLMQKHISSYKDLPTSVYQIQTKFRNELRAKAGLIRGREFSMKDLYSFHADQKDLDNYYEVAKDAYLKIFERCGLGEKTIVTFASGGAFSKYSHEFQTLAEAGEDKIFVCDKCKLAVNQEIIEEQKVCPECGNKDLHEEKGIEVGNIFKLGTRFSKPFGLVFDDEKGERQDVIMGCYGIGPARVMGTIVELHHDDKGIIWPEEVAPFKIHLLRLKSKDAKVQVASDKLYDDLKQAGIECLYDDREDAGAGEKFTDADLIGCPVRIVISDKTLALDSVEVKKRNEEKASMVKIKDIINTLK